MPKTPTSPFSSFDRATSEAYTKHRMLALLVGEPGSRKTTFCLEAPGPTVVLSLDQGLEGVVNRILDEQPEKEIYVKEYDWHPVRDEDLQATAVEIRDQFTADYETAVVNARTVIVDKETDVWGLFRYAEFGPEGNDAPRNYPALNARYRKMVNMAKASDANVFFIEGMKDEWGTKINSKTGAQGAASTGKRIRSGFGELDGLVHMVLYFEGLSPNDWKMHVGKVRGPGAMDVAGQTFEGGLKFSDFAQLVFPDSTEEEWS